MRRILRKKNVRAVAERSDWGARTCDVGAVGILGDKMGIRGKETMKVIPGGNQMSLYPRY